LLITGIKPDDVISAATISSFKKTG